MANADAGAGRAASGTVVLVRPGRVLFGGMVLLYLLAYLRGPALLVAVIATVGLLLWRSGGTRGRRTSGGPSSEQRWGVRDGPVATRPLAAEVRDGSSWRMAPTVVQGMAEPAADQPVGFTALVELRDRAGRQAMLQLEAVHPAEADLEGLIRQALGQAVRRGGWQLHRWQPITDATFTPAAREQVGEWRR